MKFLFLPIVMLLSMHLLFAQAPQLMNYQAVVRDVSGQVVANQTPVKLRFTIHNDSTTGPAVFTETQSATTNQFGLVNVEIGKLGSLVIVDWSTAAKYLQVEVDINNTGLFINMGATQLISVPYALFAANSAPGPQGATGARGATGTGIAGPMGATGAVGGNGLTGATGAAGNMGVTGPTGYNGLNGVTGATGVAGSGGGATGPTGTTGAMGQSGLVGATGNNGLNGITGATGAPGLQGITGANGATGAAGVTGALGLQGVTGADGQPGTAGATGIQGLQGATGNNGLNGVTGAPGANGLQGPTGNNGMDGVTGATGTQGLQGVTGIDGQAGAIGATGAQGLQGATGNNGLNGVTGATGVQGLQGVTGANGQTGALGATGLQGVTGNNGLNGITGATGAQGLQGVTGADGQTGAVGATGANGSQNAWGLTGNTGTSSATNFIGTIDANDLVFKTNNTENMRLSSAGYLGIGANPPYPLTVVAGSSPFIVAYMQGASATGSWMRLINTSTGGTGWRLISTGSGNGEGAGKLIISSDVGSNQNAVFTSAGYVGIGGITSPVSYLDVQGSSSNTTSLTLRSGNFGNPVTGITSNQITFGYNGGTSYLHAIKTRHNSGAATSNAIDFYVWNYGTDASTAVGTKRVMTIDGAGPGRVGIGTAVPDTTLHIVGSLKMVDGNQGAGKIMVSDVNGVGIWTTPAVSDTQKLYLNSGSLSIGGGNTVSIGSGWLLTGNSGTAPGTNFIGTTDPQPLVFKVNGNKAGYIDYQVNPGSTAFGYQALNTLTTGTINSAFGYQALFNNTTGWGNVAIGEKTLYTNTVGFGLVAIGDSALFSNTLDTCLSVAIGTGALAKTTVSYHNVAVGYGAAANNTTGVGVTAVGFDALNAYNAGGSTPVQTANTAIGDYSMRYTLTGVQNTGLGNNSLQANTTGSKNTALGCFAMISNLTGDNNTMVGFSTMFTGTGAAGNTAVGANGLFSNTTGSNNTALGYGADVSSGALTNATAIGYNAKVSTSNSIVLGATGGSAVNVGIGLTSPVVPLDISTSNTGVFNVISQMLAGSNTTAGNFTEIRMGVATSSNNCAEMRFQYNGSGSNSNLMQLGLFGGGSNGITINGSGNVGIGTANPTQATLVVNGSQNVTTISYGYLNSGGGTGNSSNQTPNLSIYASQRIAATEFDAYSDERIKNIIGLSDNERDLSTLTQIKITDYKFVDTIAKGAGLNKKVIAQQLESVYPQAVKKITDVVPDIYKLAEIKNGYIAIGNKLQKGDRVKLIFGTHTDVYEVLIADKNGFSVNVKDEGKVFVYGTQVSDFRTVDYEALTTLNVSATQELLKMINELKDENSTLKKGKADASDVEQLKLQLDQLKQLMVKNAVLTNK